MDVAIPLTVLDPTAPPNASQGGSGGQEVFSRGHIAQTNMAPSSGQLRLTYFRARRDEILSKIVTPIGSVAAGATPTLVRFGVYSIAADGGGTLIASTASDTTLYSGTIFTENPAKSFSASLALVSGQAYAWAPLVVTGAAMPQMTGVSGHAGANAGGNGRPRLAGLLSGQTDLPSTFTDAALSTSGHRYYAAFAT